MNNDNLDIELNENEPGEDISAVGEQTEAQQPEDTSAAESAADTENAEKPEKSGRKKKTDKQKKLKNRLLIKKGGVSVAITALFIVGVIVFNILFGILSERLVLEYDFSKDKVNSLTSENVDYIKSVKKDVRIIVCAPEDDYESYAGYSANAQSIQASTDEYYAQTVKLIKKYAAYNSKIKLEFADPYSSEFSDISQKYGDKIKALGDIIVICENSGTERVKALTLTDIYDITQDDTYAYYGYSVNTLTGNNIENALTSAISYVVSDNDKKIAIYSGHSTNDFTASYYLEMLKENNYQVETFSDKVLTSVPKNCDEIVIPVADVDFSADEISVLAEYLENEGKYGKGLTVFASANAPYLPVLYDFLDEWGITVEEGKLFETDDGNYMTGDPTTLGSYDSLDSKTQICITGANVPLLASDKTNGCTVTVDFTSSGTAVAVPKDTPSDFTDADKYEKKNYATVITSEKGASVVDASDTDPAKSRVSVFSSYYFLQSEYNEYQSVANKNIAFSVTEKNCGVTKSDISFVKKEITDESFADDITEQKANLIKYIFILVIPAFVIAACIVVCVKRRNAK